MNSNLCEYMLWIHELSQNVESKSFRRFLTDNFDIKVTSDLDLNKLILPLSKTWGKIFDPKVTLNKKKGPNYLSISNPLFCQRTPPED